MGTRTTAAVGAMNATKRVGLCSIGLQNLSHGLKLRLAGRIASSPLRYPRLGRVGRGGAGRPSRRRFIPFQMELSRKERVVRLGDCLTICRMRGALAPSALLLGLLVLGGCEAALQKGLI